MRDRESIDGDGFRIPREPERVASDPIWIPRDLGSIDGDVIRILYEPERVDGDVIRIPGNQLVIPEITKASTAMSLGSTGTRS